MQDRRPPRVLFVCVENSCRSQMAEGFARSRGAEAYSCGSRPSGVVHPLAIESMRERGIDLTAQRSKGMESLGPLEFDAVVTMGCGDVCPAVPARRRFDWAIPDPKHLPPEAFRAVRDRIDAEVACLLAEL